MNFVARAAQVTVAFLASEALLGRFSYAIYHPLISSVLIRAQNANNKAALFKTEFFNSISRKRPADFVEFADYERPL